MWFGTLDMGLSDNTESVARFLHTCMGPKDSTDARTAVVFSEEVLQALLESPILLLEFQQALLRVVLPEGQLSDLLLKGLHRIHPCPALMLCLQHASMYKPLYALCAAPTEVAHHRVMCSRVGIEGSVQPTLSCW